jgi:tryptophan-rich sensory protein
MKRTVRLASAADPARKQAVIYARVSSILAFIATAWRQDRAAAWLFIPYAAWVAFASALNASILALN